MGNEAILELIIKIKEINLIQTVNMKSSKGKGATAGGATQAK